MAQYALASGDVDKAEWVEGAGDGDGDAFDELDEGFGAGRGSGSGPDDATTYWDNTGNIHINDSLRINLSPVTDPVVHTGHIIRARNRKHASGGRQIDIGVRFHQASTFIEQQFFTDVNNIWTTRGFTLSEAVAANITDYSILRMWVWGNEVGGGGPRRPQESALEFECPDAPGGGGGFAHSQGVIVG